jgi:hypothetical protein
MYQAGLPGSSRIACSRKVGLDDLKASRGERREECFSRSLEERSLVLGHFTAATHR